MKNYFQFCPKCGVKNLSEKDSAILCEGCGFKFYFNPVVCVGAIIVNKDENEILLTKRKNNPYKGWWDIPGGFLNPGEHPHDALRREIKEELGLTIITKRLIGFYPDFYEGKNTPTLNIHFLTQVNNSKMKIGSDVREARWFKISHLPKKIAFRNGRQVINDFLKGKTYENWGDE